MTSTGSWALLSGLGLGLGLWSLVATLPKLSRPRLTDRVAPYVMDVSSEAREIVDRARAHPTPFIGVVLDPALASLRTAASRVAGGNESVALRLRQAGVADGVDRFRSHQLIGVAIALAVSVPIVIALAAARPIPWPVQVAVPCLAAACVFAAQDRMLTRRARARLRRIADEFPTVIELLSLSLSAGEGILDALRRVSAAGTGELAGELAGVVADARVGIPLADALGGLARDIRLPVLTRCLDAIGTALERGTPLSGVLRAQAGDAREEAKRELLESAGKKEIAMLVPLVFLILPVTVLFAIYPGLFVLQSGF